MTKHSIKAKDITKNHVIHLKVTANEKQILQRKAHDCRMPLSEFMLKAGLGRQIRPKVDTDNTDIIVCLSIVNQTVREAFHNSGRQYPELMKVIDASVRVIDLIGQSIKSE
jgi:hypothetical protein